MSQPLVKLWCASVGDKDLSSAYNRITGRDYWTDEFKWDGSAAYCPEGSEIRGVSSNSELWGPAPAGDKEQFATGAQRDTQTGKLRYDLIPAVAILRTSDQAYFGWMERFPDPTEILDRVLHWARGDTNQDWLALAALATQRCMDGAHEALTRLAVHYAKGAVKYGENNWQKGMPFSRMYASMLRHIMAELAGEDSEDHLAAALFGLFCLQHYEHEIRAGRLPVSLWDMGTPAPVAS